MGQSSSLHRGAGSARQRIQFGQLHVVHHRLAHAARERSVTEVSYRTHVVSITCFHPRAFPQGDLDSNGGRHVVVLHSDHDLVLHGQSGGFPHRGEDGIAHRVRRRFGQTDENQIRLRRVGINRRFLPGEIFFNGLLKVRDYEC